VPACGRSPDYRAFAEDKVRTYDFGATLNITCWTQPAVIPGFFQCGQFCDPGINPIWFKTMEDCYIADYNVQIPSNISILDQLKYCPNPLRQDSRFREQYGTSTYCYSCAALTCDSKFFDSKSQNVELSCWATGENVRGDEYAEVQVYYLNQSLTHNRVWWKLKSENCWIPNQVFDPLQFAGKYTYKSSFSVFGTDINQGMVMNVSDIDLLYIRIAANHLQLLHRVNWYSSRASPEVYYIHIRISVRLEDPYIIAWLGSLTCHRGFAYHFGRIIGLDQKAYWRNSA
jgi:hypothetical protein